MKTKLLTLLTLLVLCVTGAWATDYTFNFNDGTSTGLTIANANSNSSYSIANQTTNNIPVLDGYFLASSFTSNSNGVITITTDASYTNIQSISFNSASTDNSNPKIAAYIVDSEDVETSILSAIVMSSGTTKTWRGTSYTIDLSSTPKTGKVRFKLTTGSSGKYAGLDNIVITTGASTKATDPTFSPDGGDVDGNSTVTLSSDGTMYYQWSDTEAALTTASEGWTEGTSVKVPNEDGTKYLYAYATNGTGYESNVVHKEFNITAVVSSDVTATWAFSTGAVGQTAVIDVDDVFSTATVSVAKMDYNGAITWGDPSVTGSKMRPTESASDDKSQYVKFTLTPKKGITFTPTSISFDALRVGTDGSNKLHYYVECGETSTELGNVNPNRNDATKNTGDDKNTWSHYSHAISEITSTKDEPLSLSLYVYGLATNKDIAFANIVIAGNYSGTPEEETNYTVTTSVTPVGAGTITQTPAGTSLAEGTPITFSATANEGYVFLNKWTVNDVEQDGATYNIASLAANTTVVAQFRALYSVSYDTTGEGVVKGTNTEVLGVEYANASDKWTAPNNLYMKKDGYTFSKWIDANDNEYIPGTEYTLTGNITISPFFVPNSQPLATSLAANTANTVVTWNFRNSEVYFNSQGNNLYYVKQATVNGETYDFPMYCNTASGKLNNSNRNDQWIQANNGTVLTIPAVAGMTVDFGNTRYQFGRDGKTATTVGGNNYSSRDGSSEYNYTASYDYSGAASTIDIVIGEDIAYMSTITVTYPAFVETVTKLADRTYGTYVATSNLDFTAVDDMEAYIATGLDGSVTIEKVTKVPAGAAIIVKTADKSVTSVNVPVAASADALTTNLLVAGDGVTAWDGTANTTYYFLKQDQFHQATSGTLQSGKAYLAIDSSLAKEMTISIGGDDDMTTTIDNLTISQFDKNATRYNLAGQKVSDSYKGIVIVNGKKYINK